MTAQPIPETPDGYLARAKAVHKLGVVGRRYRCFAREDECACCCPVTVGELLHAADVMSA